MEKALLCLALSEIETRTLIQMDFYLTGPLSLSSLNKHQKIFDILPFVFNLLSLA